MLPHGRTIFRRYALEVFLKAPLFKITGRFLFARFTFIRYIPIFRAGRGGAWGTVWSCVWFLPPFFLHAAPRILPAYFPSVRGEGCHDPCGADSLKQTWSTLLPNGDLRPLSWLYMISSPSILCSLLSISPNVYIGFNSSIQIWPDYIVVGLADTEILFSFSLPCLTGRKHQFFAVIILIFG